MSTGFQAASMYTRIVKLRAVALAVALVLAVSPALGALCEISCDAPAAAPAAVQSEADCHRDTESATGIAMRASAHPCGHQHTNIPALAAGANQRDVAVASSSALSAFLAHAIEPLAEAHAPLPHGPPGVTGQTPPLTTILRI